jgi:hypothetical protein
MTAKERIKIHFDSFGGSGPLGVYWYDAPYGLAQESAKGDGVVFLSPNGELLGAIFDDVDEAQDDQVLMSTKGHRIHIVVKNKKVNVDLTMKRRRA